MDTKWKNRKIVISFILFFTGVSLVLGNAVNIMRAKPGDLPVWQISRIFHEDYQQSSRFRSYISNRLEVFLAMATNNCGFLRYDSQNYNGNIYYNGNYYDDGYYDREYYDSHAESEAWQRIWERYQDTLEQLEKYENRIGNLPDSGYSDKEYQALLDQLEEYEDELDEYEDSPDFIAENYHNSIKADQNLIYSISYDGNVLYTNSELLSPNDNTIPEGYNFLLRFDGEKVRIFKDDQELNVYNDGFYRDDSLWYVPGYRNFPVDESMKKATVLIAAAREPVLYTEGTYGNGGYRQMDNPLYWMYNHWLELRNALTSDIAWLTLGILLLLFSLLMRKSRLEAYKAIASVQSKVWVECKLILLFIPLYTIYKNLFIDGSGYDLFRELTYISGWEYGTEVVTLYGWQLLWDISSLAWLTLFWGCFLAANDLRHNKKIWRQGLICKLYRTFSAREINLSLSLKMAHRNIIAFTVTLLCTLLTAGICLWNTNYGRMPGGAALTLILLAVCILLMQYFTGAKNMRTARSVENLTNRIRDIRNGDYREYTCSRPKDSDKKSVTQPWGHDLDNAMEQLEDIRHGMASAVDEQMKSERMKVELIANVSHDIKTPLTSIISYVQFLKQEENLPDHVKDYVSILDEKSQRLKNMVQDVFAVSKAASGELPMHMEELDFGKLLLQTLADMEEEISGSPAAFRTEVPDTPVMIMADGQRMYRVFQNLFQNAIKYSLQGSRVFVTLKQEKDLAVASVKNTSCHELEKDKDFAERFSRGDQSRTDGGSGLGLSIAQSFTEACGGTFCWETDADLFIVKVSFHCITETAQSDS